MLREVVSSLRSTKTSRDPVALFRQLSHQYASSSAPASKADTPSQTSPAVDTLRQRLAAGMACSVIQATVTERLKRLPLAPAACTATQNTVMQDQTSLTSRLPRQMTVTP